MKKVLTIGVGAVVLGAVAVGGAWVAGGRLPAEHEVRMTVASRQGPTAVWRVVSDLEGQPAWRTDLTSIERIDDIAGKPAWRETRSGGEAITVVTAGLEPPHSLTRDIVEDGLFMGSWTVDLVPEGMGTRVTLTERGITPSPFARLLQSRSGGPSSHGGIYLRSLADHLGDHQNQVVAVEAETAE